VLAGFGRSIVDTARGWVDESQLVMPSHRDRIVTILHDDREEALTSRCRPMSSPCWPIGDAAGRWTGSALCRRQAGVVPARGGISAGSGAGPLAFYLPGRLGDGYSHRSDGEAPYADLAGPEATASLPSYVLTDIGGRL
jgi:hypothetical protein